MIAITTARAESSRLPSKNILPLCGIPLIGWTIIQALNCKLVDEMYVVTEDNDIAKISEGYGAKVIRHPYNQELDRLGSMCKLKYGLDRIKKPTDSFMALTACMPLRKPGGLDELIERFEETGARVMITAIPIDDRVVMYPLGNGRAQKISEFHRGGYLKRNNGQFVCTREWFYEWYYKKLYSEVDGIWPSGTNAPNVDVYVEWEKWQDADIDYEDDLKYCEFWMKEKQLNREENYETYHERTRQTVQSLPV